MQAYVTSLTRFISGGAGPGPDKLPPAGRLVAALVRERINRVTLNALEEEQEIVPPPEPPAAAAIEAEKQAYAHGTDRACLAQSDMVVEIFSFLLFLILSAELQKRLDAMVPCITALEAALKERQQLAQLSAGARLPNPSPLEQEAGAYLWRFCAADPSE